MHYCGFCTRESRLLGTCTLNTDPDVTSEDQSRRMLNSQLVAGLRREAQPLLLHVGRISTETGSGTGSLQPSHWRCQKCRLNKPVCFYRHMYCNGCVSVNSRCEAKPAAAESQRFVQTMWTPCTFSQFVCLHLCSSVTY